MSYETTVDDLYVCPRSRAALRSEGQLLRSETGDITYPLKVGIPQFLRDTVRNPHAEELRMLNDLAREHGWEVALRTVYGEQPAMLRYVMRADRDGLLGLLPLSPDSDVLEIGPGLGQFTCLLARRARSVRALEIDPGQAEFVAQRCAQQGLANVRVAVGGDDCRLPYADRSFDVVVLNLVLEWCATRCVDEPMIDVHRRLLSEAARTLRPGGAFYLATKNRYALKYLLGKQDEHAHGMRFGSALPRALMQWALRRRGHARPSGWLHSHAALEALLREAGFASTRSFWATPEMRYPSHYIPTDAASVRAARRRGGLVQGEGRTGRWLMPWVPAAWVKNVAPGLAFLAVKAE